MGYSSLFQKVLSFPSQNFVLSKKYFLKTSSFLQINCPRHQCITIFKNHTSANFIFYKVGIWLCYHESSKYSYFSEENEIKTSNSLKV